MEKTRRRISGYKEQAVAFSSLQCSEINRRAGNVAIADKLYGQRHRVDLAPDPLASFYLVKKHDIMAADLHAGILAVWIQVIKGNGRPDGSKVIALFSDLKGFKAVFAFKGKNADKFAGLGLYRDVFLA